MGEGLLWRRPHVGIRLRPMWDDGGQCSGAHHAVWPASQWAPPELKIFYYSNSAQTSKLKNKTFAMSKNTQILYDAIFEYFEQLSQLGQLQNLRIDVINSGTKSN
jgi:hypothetical protein